MSEQFNNDDLKLFNELKRAIINCNCNIDDCNTLTSGNIAHHKIAIKARSESLKKAFKNARNLVYKIEDAIESDLY